MSKRTYILAAFVVLKFVLQYMLISPEYDLQRDEYLHLDQANHLAWGYLSIPPFTSWISWIIAALGNGVFWVKFFPSLFGALTIIVVWKTVAALNGNLFALILSATCILFSALLRLNTLFQPNSFEVLCWAGFYFCMVKYFGTEKLKWLYGAAIIFAFGFLNKYNIAFSLIGLLPAILITPQRRMFGSRHVYLAALLAFILILPNLLWQWNNNFPVIHHMKELANTQLVHVDRLDFLRSQLLFFLGSVLVIIAAIYALAFYPPFKKYRPFLWSFFFTLIAFMYFRAKDYYAIGLYPVYIAFGAAWFGESLKQGWRRYLQPVLIAIPVLLFIPFYNIGFPNKSPEAIVANPGPYKELGMLRWEDGKDHLLPQDFADMLGWKALALKVDSIVATLPHPGNTLLLCDNYGQAGAINYYGKNKIIASSFHADYVNWLHYDREIRDVILVKGPGDKDPFRHTEKPFFDSVYLAAQRINRFAREDTISIYVLRGARIDVNERIKGEADQKKRLR